MNTTNTTPTVGPVAANLLNALRSLEQARNYYFLATEQIRPTRDGEVLTDQENDAFDAVADIIKRDFDERLTLWASALDTTQPI